MTHPGYQWTISPDGADWRWVLWDHDRGQSLVEGRAPSRAVAAAMVVRALARGMTEAASVAESVAA